MKKHPRFCVYLLFTVLYALVLSVGAECLLNLLGVAFALSLDGMSVTAQYPRFLPFCLILGLLALVGLIVLIVVNIKGSAKWQYTRGVWIAQWVCALALSLPLIPAWEWVFRFLQQAL